MQVPEIDQPKIMTHIDIMNDMIEIGQLNVVDDVFYFKNYESAIDFLGVLILKIITILKPRFLPFEFLTKLNINIGTLYNLDIKQELKDFIIKKTKKITKKKEYTTLYGIIQTYFPEHEIQINIFDVKKTMISVQLIERKKEKIITKSIEKNNTVLQKTLKQNSRFDVFSDSENSDSDNESIKQNTKSIGKIKKYRSWSSDSKSNDDSSDEK
jgi:hypothetical protein